jgi:plasmid stabilization system protein ParE
MATRRRRVVWALRARRAVDDALTYIADDLPQAGADLAARVIERAEGLATLSERGRIVPELADPSLRELIVVAPYRLLCEVHRSEVWIVGFLHGRQDFGTWRRGQS